MAEMGRPGLPELRSDFRKESPKRKRSRKAKDDGQRCGERGVALGTRGTGTGPTGAAALPEAVPAAVPCVLSPAVPTPGSCVLITHPVDFLCLGVSGELPRPPWSALRGQWGQGLSPAGPGRGAEPLSPALCAPPIAPTHGSGCCRPALADVGHTLVCLNGWALGTQACVPLLESRPTRAVLGWGCAEGDRQVGRGKQGGLCPECRPRD